MQAPKKVPAKCDPEQVNQVVKWILSGSSSFDIFEAIRANFSDANAAELMLEAMGHFETAGMFDPDIVRGWCFEACRDLYRRMVEDGDFPGALRAVKQILEMARNVPNREDGQEDAEEARSPEAIQ